MEVILGHLDCPLSGGCPLFGGFVIGGSTVHHKIALESFWCAIGATKLPSYISLES